MTSKRLDFEMTKLLEVYGKEELHPDLAAAYRPDPLLGGTINHPLLVQVLHVPMLNRLVNRCYLQSLQQLKAARKSENWERYIFIHARPYRAQALMEVLREVLQKPRGWKIIGQVWTDSEYPGVNLSFWSDIFSRPDAGKMMDAKERKRFQALPDKVRIYRGAKVRKFRGLSWTLDKKVAEKFALRHGCEGRVVGKTICPWRDAVAYLDHRSEEEIILQPRLALRRQY